MMKNNFLFLRKSLMLASVLISSTALSAINNSEVKDALLKKYAINYSDKAQLLALKSETQKLGGKSVEALVEVMKNGKYPDKNRWIATFMLGEIMGDKSAPFLAKFFKHPSWVMRMASLKTMLALKQNNYSREYSSLLSDNSYLVRSQALENIKTLKIVDSAPQVWAMLYDKKNYDQPKLNGKSLKTKRSHIIKSVIETVGVLKFSKAKEPLLKMIQKDRYNDIFNEMDNSLALITGQKSPNADMKKKRIFWQRMSLNTTIE